MKFNSHFEQQGDHAFLSASKYHWIRYDADKLSSAYRKFLAAKKGTELHAFACECIRLGIKLPKSRKSLNNYVNDAIGFRMTPEQVLYYSPNSFGTADTICYRDKMLRIHDLKTGVSPVSMDQLEVYVALFCLEYKVNPKDIDIELRLYQSDEIVVHKPEWKDIKAIMDKTIEFDKILESIKLELED